jgi:hypothetical protein
VKSHQSRRKVAVVKREPVFIARGEKCQKEHVTFVERKMCAGQRNNGEGMDNDRIVDEIFQKDIIMRRILQWGRVKRLREKRCRKISAGDLSIFLIFFGINKLQ